MDRMILGYHVIFCAYGFWLPNDPRGSWSDFIGAWEILRFGAASTTGTRRSVAHVRHDQTFRRAAKQALKYPPVQFTGVQAVSIAHGFRVAMTERAYIVHACAILPEHVHLVIGRHERDIGRIVGHMKTRATQRLQADGHTWPGEQSPWAEGKWCVFLDSDEAMRRAIEYVERNPAKEGLPRQMWRLVTTYG
jgi:REP element-mobilizing transposase RayT